MTKVGSLLLVAAFLLSAGRTNAYPRLTWIPRGDGLYRCQVHRSGGVNTLPECALESMLWCWGNGCTPEADARLTKDGVAISFHDDTLSRLARGIPDAMRRMNVCDLTWDELADVDTGSYLDTTYSFVRIATMDSVFAAMRHRPTRLLHLDEKGAPPEMMAEMSAHHGVQEQTYYCSEDWRKAIEWKKSAPQGRTMVWLHCGWPQRVLPEIVDYTDSNLRKSLAEMAAFGFDGIDQVQIHVRADLTLDDPFCPSSAALKRAIDQLHAAGVCVMALSWDAGDDPEVYRRLWDLGFDLFATDYPRTFLDVVPELRATAVRPELRWTGAGDGNWDLSSDNWSEDGAATRFATGRDVRFDDSAVCRTVCVPSANGEGPVSGTVVFSNETDYVLSGGAPMQSTGIRSGLQGATRFVKQGGGTLTVTGYHSYAGDLVVAGGELTTEGTAKGDLFNAHSSPIGDFRSSRRILVLTNATLSIVSQGVGGAGTSTEPVLADLEVHGGTVRFCRNWTTVLGNVWFDDATLDYYGGNGDVWRTFCFYGNHVRFSGRTPYVLPNPNPVTAGIHCGRWTPTKFIVDDITGDDGDDVTFSTPIRAITGRSDGNGTDCPFEKWGKGTLALNHGYNTFVGDVRISEGTLHLTQSARRAAIGETSSGLGNLTVPHGVTVETGATLWLDGSDHQGQYYNDSKLTVHVRGGTLRQTPSTCNSYGPVILENATLSYAGDSGYEYYWQDDAGTVRSVKGPWPTFGFHGGVSFKGTNAYVLANAKAHAYDEGSTMGFGANGMSDVWVDDITGDDRTDVTIGMPIVDGGLWATSVSRDGKAFITGTNQAPRAATWRKTGPGTLVLSASNPYTGDTSVCEGLLIVDGSVPGSALTVSEGAGLGGRGSVGNVTFADGAVLDARCGTLRFGRFRAGAILKVRCTDMENLVLGTVDGFEGRPLETAVTVLADGVEQGGFRLKVKDGVLTADRSGLAVLITSNERGDE